MVKKSNTQVIREMLQYVDKQMTAIQCEVKMSFQEREILRERFAAEFLRSEGILLEPGVDAALDEGVEDSPTRVDDEEQ